jgi:DNA-binding LacI/PurR family transcriptional regulator
MSQVAAHPFDWIIPHVTTVHVPAESMWRGAAERALAILRGETPARETPIEVSLLMRASTRHPAVPQRLRR